MTDNNRKNRNNFVEELVKFVIESFETSKAIFNEGRCRDNEIRYSVYLYIIDELVRNDFQVNIKKIIDCYLVLIGDHEVYGDYLSIVNDDKELDKLYAALKKALINTIPKKRNMIKSLKVNVLDYFKTTVWNIYQLADEKKVPRWWIPESEEEQLISGIIKKIFDDDDCLWEQINKGFYILNRHTEARIKKEMRETLKEWIGIHAYAQSQG